MASVYESKNSKFQIIMWGFFFIVILFSLLPILNVLAVSFSSKEAILAGKVGIFPVGFNTEAYKMIFKDSSMIRAFFVSIGLTAASTVISMLGTILAAYPLSKKRMLFREKIMVFIVITMYFAPGIIPNYLLVKNLGLLDNLWSLILPGMISAYNLIILRSFFSSISESLFEAAYIDGCNEWQVLFKVGIPLAMPAILTLSLFYAVTRWNTVQDVIFYINDSQLYTIQFKLKQMLDIINLPIGEQQNIPVVAENLKSASLMFAMAPMLVVYPFVQKYFTKGMMLGGVKE